MSNATQPKPSRRPRNNGQRRRAHRASPAQHRILPFAKSRLRPGEIGIVGFAGIGGSQADNLADMRARGRAHLNPFPSGVRHPNAKLTPARVREIRAIYADGALSMATIGSLFGLAAGTVHQIVTRKTWAHVTEEG